MNKDIQFKKNHSVINCRVSGILIKENKVLLHKKKVDDFWNLVGGKIKIGESSDKALIREFDEELKIGIYPQRLVCIAENFFSFKKFFHEFNFIYLIECSNIENITDDFFEKDTYYKWFLLDDIENINIKPSFIKKFLLKIPSETTHLIHKDNYEEY